MGNYNICVINAQLIDVIRKYLNISIDFAMRKYVLHYLSRKLIAIEKSVKAFLCMNESYEKAQVAWQSLFEPTTKY